ncbi:MAG: hypothetical protein M3Q07_04725 [Pseudobdellovibrionaceae bacterium]|nr:hypothetical protein [Pseudobdellovibrionaceae bacterium]
MKILLTILCLFSTLQSAHGAESLDGKWLNIGDVGLSRTKTQVIYSTSPWNFKAGVGQCTVDNWRTPQVLSKPAFDWIHNKSFILQPKYRIYLVTPETSSITVVLRSQGDQYTVSCLVGFETEDGFYARSTDLSEPELEAWIQSHIPLVNDLVLKTLEQSNGLLSVTDAPLLPVAR